MKEVQKNLAAVVATAVDTAVATTQDLAIR